MKTSQTIMHLDVLNKLAYEEQQLVSLRDAVESSPLVNGDKELIMGRVQDTILSVSELGDAVAQAITYDKPITEQWLVDYHNTRV